MKAEGAVALATGFGPTAVGYFIQGWFKFGGVEFFKVQAAKALGERDSFKYRVPIYLGAAGKFLNVRGATYLAGQCVAK